MYTYKLRAGRYGGEFVKGVLTPQQTDYWIKKSNDEFLNYMFDWEVKEEMDKKLPQDVQLPEWHEITDITHFSGVELSAYNFLDICCADTEKEIASIELDIPVNGDGRTIEDTNDYDGDDAIFYGYSWEKGGWEFEDLVTDKPFDESKLIYSVDKWDDQWFLTGINYGNESLGIDGGDSTGKQIGCWID